MVMGCTSDAGKSFLVTALCRYLANQGLSVAPFKAQNMSNQAAVTSDGLEIGRAQYLQAIASRQTPDVRMNPVLLKPESDTFSQVIVRGSPDRDIAMIPWMERRHRLWPVVQEALKELIHEHDCVVIEGAGSPAEVNLREADIVNMSVALECQADVFLVADIDRGGAFAHLLGTWMCLSEAERSLVKGFVLNKFRGDPQLLGNAMDWLREKTGVPTVAIVPMTPHALPEEDTLHHRGKVCDEEINLALLSYPYASNFEEFDPFRHEQAVNLVPVRDYRRLNDFHAIFLPGSKNTAASLDHLRRSGLAAEISRAAARGIPVYGVCGGLQMLGTRIIDESGIEGGSVPGLGLLDVETTFHAQKTTRRTTLMKDGYRLEGYEIHHGRTQAGRGVEEYLSGGLGWRQGNIRGVYLHGIFENTAYRQDFLHSLGWSGQSLDWKALMESELDRISRLIPVSGWADFLPINAKK